MAEPRILKGIYKEGTVVASAIIEAEGNARLMVKGAEPKDPKDDSFGRQLKAIASKCKKEIGDVKSLEINAVFAEAGSAEQISIEPELLKGMGVTRVLLLDAECGLPIRVFDDDPVPVPLAYESLRAAGDLKEQPGCVDVPDRYVRKLYKDLGPGERKVFEAIVQLAGRGLMKIVCLEDETVKMALALKDFPPARARSVVVPLADLGKEITGGATIEKVAKKLEGVRGG
jgi:hypothetical protein